MRKQDVQKFYKYSSTFKACGLHTRTPLAQLLWTIESGPGKEVGENLSWVFGHVSKDGDDLTSIRDAIVPLQQNDRQKYQLLIPGLDSLYAKYKSLESASKSLACYKYLALALCGNELRRIKKELMESGKVRPEDASNAARQQLYVMEKYDDMTAKRKFRLVNSEVS